ncbi:MAG: alpha/beta fold hydrolase [Nitrospirae bacterium]|nr:MAG: alpha/beta fold hydrolase [Nitrospirota bacterium]
MLCRSIFLVLIFVGLLSVTTTGYGEDVTAGFAEVNGTKLYYEVKGKGQAIVFIHSGGFDRRIWDDQFNIFAEHYKAIRYDVRGYGKSLTPTRPYSDEEDLYQLLKFLKVSKAHIVGLSLGGRIAIDFALTHPEMVETLIPVASGLSGYAFSPQDMIEILKIVYSIQKDDGTPAGEVWLQSPYNAPAMENPDVAKKLRPIAIENSHVWLMNFLFPRPPLPLAIQRLSEIRVPTLLIMGDRDVPGIKTIVQILETGIPGAKKVIISGAGHVVNMEKPEEFNRVVLDFLSKQ